MDACHTLTSTGNESEIRAQLPAFRRAIAGQIGARQRTCTAEAERHGLRTGFAEMDFGQVRRFAHHSYYKRPCLL